MAIKVKQKWILGGVLLTIALLLLSSVSPTLSWSGISTDTREFPIAGGHDNWAKITGHIELEKTDYAVGWKPGSLAESEPFIVAGSEYGIDRNSYFDTYDREEIQWSGYVAGKVKLSKYWYEWYVDGDRVKVSTEHNTPSDTKVLDSKDEWNYEYISTRNYVSTDTATTTKTGVSEIEVFLMGVVSFYTAESSLGYPDGWSTPEQYVLSTDKANLHAGSCEIGMANQYDKVYETGQQAEVVIQTGWTGGKGWTVYITPPSHTGIGRYEYMTIGDGVDKTYLIDVEEDWFKEGDVNSNKVLVEVWSPIFEAGETTFFTIDDRDKMPTLDSATLSNTNIKAGESVTITMTATPNERTNLPINHFELSIWPGDDKDRGTSYFVVENIHITATANGDGSYSGSHTFQTTETSYYTCEVEAMDTGGRASNTLWPQLSSTVAGDDPPPPPPPIGDYGFMMNAYAIATIIIGSLMAFAWFLKGIDDPLSAKIGIPRIIPTLIIIVITLYMAYKFGTDPTLSTWVL